MRDIVALHPDPFTERIAMPSRSSPANQKCPCIPIVCPLRADVEHPFRAG